MSSTSPHHLQNLPSLTNITAKTPQGDPLQVQFLLDPEEIEALWPVVQQAANDPQRKDRPFALDEFNVSDDFSEWAQSGYVVLLTNAATHGVLGYGILTASWFNRISRPIVADIRVMTHEPNPSTGLLATLLGSLTEVAKCIGYYGAIINILQCNTNQIAAARLNGYNDFLFINKSGRIPKTGLIESQIFFKSLQPDKPMPEPNHPSVQHLADKYTKDFEHRPRIDSEFPIQMYLGDGSPVTVTPMQEHHIVPILELFQGAAARGDGYGTSELPNMEQLQCLVDGEVQGYAFIAEIDGKPVGLVFVGPSYFCRSMNPELADCWVVVDPKQSAKGMATFFGRLWLKLSYMLGYKASMTETYLSNVPVIRIMRNTGCAFMGSKANAGYLEGKGYEDTLYFYRETIKDDPEHPAIAKL